MPKRDPDSPPPISNPYSSHAPPTLADIQLPPRRPLRDGSNHITTSSSTPASLRLSLPLAPHYLSSRTSPSSTGIKRSRSGSLLDRPQSPHPHPHPQTTDQIVPGPSTTCDLPPLFTAAESTRRLPRLYPRVRPPEDQLIVIDDSSDDEPLSGAGHRALPESSPHRRPRSSPKPRSLSGGSSKMAASSAVPAMENSSDDEPLAHALIAGRQHASEARRSPTPNGAGASVSVGPRVTASSSSSDSSDSSPRRYTAADKGKGRAPPEPTSESASPRVYEVEDGDSETDGFEGRKGDSNDHNDSIQWLSSAPFQAEEETQEEEPVEVIGEDEAITAYNCPICFCPPTIPVMVPCGHVMCYECLHQSLVAALARGGGPRPPPGQGPPDRRRGGRTSRPDVTSDDWVQPSNWTTALLQEVIARAHEDQDIVTAARMARAELISQGIPPRDAARIADDDRRARRPQVEILVKGLWRTPEGVIIEGDCPLCRKPIQGGLGPYGSKTGGVIFLESFISYAV